MADEQHRWLDRETAERLLGGESPEAVDPVGREQAERLARVLGALSAPPPPAGGELPGEAAALAVFRTVREERAEQAAQDTDGGLVGIAVPPAGRPGAERGPRWARPARFGLAAALTVGMVGGAAVLAGTGVLPAPSGVSGPAATATATTSPERPLPPRSERDAPGGARPGDGDPDKPSGDADGGTGQQDGPGTGVDEDGGVTEPGMKTDDPAAGNGRGKQIASACRALRDGRKLPGSRKRLLEDAAGGFAHVGPYCENVLAAHGAGADTGTGAGPDSGSGSTAKSDGGGDTGTGRGDDATGSANNGTGDGGTEGAANGDNGNGKGNATGNADADGNANGDEGRGGKNGKGADTSG
ncbi:hypothetical protein [Streptomyces sp. AVP053U2]|uniref:hypothetical protein n=1 Tax=Streptomyces sp. AVP053U2 TaxID=1737066 RepID=UPI00073BDE6D|nr:hypothetical protein [Streptomyces sp. AVP053U2]ODA71794.1 hypothetical protein APS67_004107 [Streptomyces sp. AVP053U2]